MILRVYVDGLSFQFSPDMKCTTESLYFHHITLSESHIMHDCFLLKITQVNEHDLPNLRKAWYECLRLSMLQ